MGGIYENWLSRKERWWYTVDDFFSAIAKTFGIVGYLTFGFLATSVPLYLCGMHNWLILLFISAMVAGSGLPALILLIPYGITWIVFHPLSTIAYVVYGVLFAILFFSVGLPIFSVILSQSEGY